MKNYALKRLLQLIPILLAIKFLSYGMMRIAGSDVVEQKMENTSGTVSQEMIDNARAELGLDKPFVVQYFTWLGNLLRGDMGTSYVSNKPVFSTFVSKLPATLLLTAVSILLTVLISIGHLRRRQPAERGVACPDAGDRHVGQVSAAGPRNRSG